METKKKKHIIIGVVIVVAVIAAAAAAVWFLFFREPSTSQSAGEGTAYVDSISNITGLGTGNGMQDRFSGVVEPQKTWNVELAQDRKVKDIYVQEGEEVALGSNLFEYDTADQEESLNQAQIDLERLQNEIDTTTAQIELLQKEKANASQEDQLDYTTRIQTAQNTIKRNEYDIKKKNVEIEQLKNTIANSIVTCELDGVVKKINQDSSGNNSPMGNRGENNAFMTILATGDYRVKGKVNEQNMWSIMEGQPVIVRSRVDAERIWKGTITTIDLENPETDNNSSGGYISYGGPGGASNPSENSTNYPFYITLENADDLMLGQHVYIEMDNGQEDGEEKEGIWLDSYYIVQEDGKAFVWAADEKDKLEKRSITLGELDDTTQKYHIAEGLETDDYITFPNENLKEGMSVVRNIQQMGMNGGINNMGMEGSGDGIPLDAAPGGGLEFQGDVDIKPGDNDIVPLEEPGVSDGGDGGADGPGDIGSSDMIGPEIDSPADGEAGASAPGPEASDGQEAGSAAPGPEASAGGEEGPGGPDEVLDPGDGSAPADTAQ